MYCNVVDLKNYIPENTLVDLTDDSNTGNIDSDKANDAMQRAQDFVDAHLMGRYTLPLTMVPLYIKDIAVKLSIYFLYKRSLAPTFPEPIVEDYKYCIVALQKIQAGKINPFGILQEPAFFETNKSYSDRVFVLQNVPNGNMFSPSPINPMVANVRSNPNQVNLNTMLL